MPNGSGRRWRRSRGVKRRFEFYVNTPRQVYMDDYAHHPRELAATLTSVRKMFPGRRITALFQPHLYTRTRDFYAGFAEALSHADEAVVLPIYPACEEPIPGVTSEIIAERVTVPCRIVPRAELAATVAAMQTDVVISFGAGDIDACCEAIAAALRPKRDGRSGPGGPARRAGGSVLRGGFAARRAGGGSEIASAMPGCPAAE